MADQTLKERVALNTERYTQLKEDVAEVKVDVRSIKENHLPHIQEELSEIKDMVKYNGWRIGLIVGIASAAASFVAKEVVAYLIK